MNPDVVTIFRVPKLARRAGAERMTVPHGCTVPARRILACTDGVVAAETRWIQQHFSDVLPVVVGPAEAECDR